MPLVGVKCPYYHGNVDFEECLACASSRGHVRKCGYPYSFLKAVSVILTKPRPEIHVTDLVGCLRRAYFSKVSNYYESPSQWIAAVLGIIIHKGLEDFRPDGSIAEIPLSATTTSGIKVVGRVDLLHNGRIIDWKTKRYLMPSKLPTRENEMQINIYYWLLASNGYEVTGGTLEYLALRGATRCDKCKCLLRETYDGWECPECHKTWDRDKAHQGLYRADIHLRDLREIAQWIDERAVILQNALSHGVIPPKTDGKWLCNYCSFREQCTALDELEA